MLPGRPRTVGAAEAPVEDAGRERHAVAQVVVLVPAVELVLASRDQFDSANWGR